VRQSSDVLSHVRTQPHTDIHMLQLAKIERGKWASHSGVTLLELVQSIYIIALVMLCVWDEVQPVESIEMLSVRQVILKPHNLAYFNVDEHQSGGTSGVPKT